MRLVTRTLTAAFLFVGLILPVQAQRASNDWNQWRGPNRDGSAPAPSDPKAWPEKLTQKWKVEVGSGYATPLVVGNRIYQFSRQGEREVMTALDVDTGKMLWQTGHDAPFTMHSAAATHGPGPKSTPAFANGRLFSIGMRVGQGSVERVAHRISRRMSRLVGTRAQRGAIRRCRSSSRSRTSRTMCT